MPRGKKKRVKEKFKKTFTQRKLRSSLIPLTPRIRLRRLDENKTNRIDTLHSFIVEDNVHLTPDKSNATSKLNKQCVKRRLSFHTDDQLTSDLLNVNKSDTKENDTIRSFTMIFDANTTPDKQNKIEVVPSPISKPNNVKRHLAYSGEEFYNESVLSSGTEDFKIQDSESSMSTVTYHSGELTPTWTLEDHMFHDVADTLTNETVIPSLCELATEFENPPILGVIKSPKKRRSSLTPLTPRIHLKTIVNNKSDSDEDPYLSSGSEYVPEDDIKHDINFPFTGSEYLPEDDIQHDINLNNNSKTQPICNTDKSNISSTSSEDYDSSSMIVTTKTKKRKKQACLYCNTLVVQLPRHLKSKHLDHPTIQTLLATTCNKEKQNMLTQLRKQGNFIYNSRVLETGKGQLVVKRRPERKAKLADEFLPCSNCLAFYNRKTLFRHMKYCDVTKRKWSRIQACSSSLLPTSKSANKLLCENVLSIMHQDRITLVVKNDSLILKFGSNLCEKFSSVDEKHLNVYISQKMRELGRLLLAVKQVNNGKQLKLSELIDPKYFDLLLESTKVVASYDVETGLYKSPSLARKLGFSLIKCSSILKASAIRSGSETARKLCDDFTILFQNEWNLKIGRHAKNTLEKAHYNKPTLLPIAEDLKTLNEYVVAKENSLLQELLMNYSYEKWADLCEIILVRLILFNRRRTGEIARLSIINFNNRSNTRANSDIFESLSEAEKHLTRQFCYVELRGKRGRKVPLLMPNSTEANILVLMNLREKAGVPETNPYVFGKLNDTSHFDGCAAFRKIVKKCNLKQPDSLRSTNLRKHIATMSQVMCLRDNEIESLASFMGHDPKIHKDYYKLPESAIYLAKISKLLLAMETGNVETYKGKNLDNINIEIDENHTQDTIADNNNDVDENDDNCESNDEDNTYQESIFQNPVINETEKKNKKKVVKRVHWSNNETEAILRHMSHFVHTREVPGKQECEECIKREPALKYRPWRSVKYWVYNQIKKRSS